MAKSKKVNKWKAAPESIRKLKEAINGTADGLSILGGLDDVNEWERGLIDILNKVLEEYNELEAKHNADCGLISKLEEEVTDYKDTIKELEETVADREAQIDNLYKQIESLKEENKNYSTLAAGLHNDTDELERTINNLEEMVELHKGEVKKLVEAADRVRDKHENEVCMLKKDVHDLEVKVKYYKEDVDDLECEVSKYKSLSEGFEEESKKLEEKLKSAEGRSEVNFISYSEIAADLRTLQEFLQKCGVPVKYRNDATWYWDLENSAWDSAYIKKIADLESRLDKVTRECNKLEDKHAKATRFVSRLTEALNDAGINFHYVKIGDDGEEVFYIDSPFKKLVEKSYEERLSRLINTIRNYEEQIRGFKKDTADLETKIYKLKKDNDGFNRRSGLLFKALVQAGIDPCFDNADDKWRIQYTGKAENAFLAADQIKRDAEEKVELLQNLINNKNKCIVAADDKIKELEKKWSEQAEEYVLLDNKLTILVSALDKCRLDAKWDCENGEWRIYVRPSDTELSNVSVNLCEVVEGYEKLKKEVEDLKSKNRSWQVCYNAVEKKVKELTAERDGLDDYVEALKGRIQELEDRSKDIYTLATIGWMTSSMREYDLIRKILAFDPKE